MYVICFLGLMFWSSSFFVLVYLCMCVCFALFFGGGGGGACVMPCSCL